MHRECMHTFEYVITKPYLELAVIMLPAILSVVALLSLCLINLSLLPLIFNNVERVG